MASPLLLETVWFDKCKYEDAERKWQEHIAKNSQCSKQKQVSKSTIVGEIARARQHIKNSLQSGDNLNISLNSFGDTSELSNRVHRLEEENAQLKEMFQDLKSLVQKLESKVTLLEGKQTSTSSVNPSTASKPQAQPNDDDDLDLFGSDEEDEEAAKVREQRLKDYEAKKSKKKAVIAKSSLVLDVKPWDDETDMKKMEEAVRNIQADGLVWGASKLVPLAYGIFKLQIGCVVEDEKISVDWLQETIQEVEDYVQSVDIAAFNKL